MLKVRYKLLIIMIMAILCAGCVSADYEGYFCIEKGACDLPEKRLEDKALIYVIRPTNLFNNAEVHHLYMVHSDGRSDYVGSYSGAEYCVCHGGPGHVQLISTGGKKESSIILNVTKNKTYYVRHNVSATLSSSKLTTHMSAINIEEGERLLRTVTAKCKKLDYVNPHY